MTPHVTNPTITNTHSGDWYQCGGGNDHGAASAFSHSVMAFSTAFLSSCSMPVVMGGSKISILL